MNDLFLRWQRGWTVARSLPPATEVDGALRVRSMQPGREVEYFAASGDAARLARLVRGESAITWLTMPVGDPGASGADQDPGAPAAAGNSGAPAAAGDRGALGADQDPGAPAAAGNSGAAAADRDPGALGADRDPGALGAVGDPGALGVVGDPVDPVDPGDPGQSVGDSGALGAVGDPAALQAAGLILLRRAEKLMTISLRAHPLRDAPDGYRLRTMVEPGPVLTVVIRDPSGSAAASGVMGLVGHDAVADKIVTMPSHRRRGLAGAVMSALARAAIDQGASTGLLVASADGQALYRRLGWQPVSDVVIASTPGAVYPD
ncbi:GNAT family N-acetyltransferase [Actinoplanes sp. TBRC 11911]|uniref:GNAT family N-acetyltransferase n=1 Tax=Actinoplanes sp. TBRC 11911 TaxID=2729386 RepID=UPI00145D00B8|nr:GNAT family N-acetyltransferase [Actinoplanes sp. TBRC 11911]NMO55755.1 GNAT family N-acetyltransferase [Actinoplanes sp. TBRC 11911]